MDRTRSPAMSGWRLLTLAVSRPIEDTNYDNFTPYRAVSTSLVGYKNRPANVILGFGVKPHGGLQPAKCLRLSVSTTVLGSQATSATRWWVCALLYVTTPVCDTLLCISKHVAWQHTHTHTHTHTHSASVGPKPFSTSWLSWQLARSSKSSDPFRPVHCY